MALQPSPRPAGSTQVLRFTGLITLGDPLATYPKENGEVTSGVAANTPVGVRFLLADATDPTNPTTTLPDFVYDDSQPAGAAPHAEFSQAIANVTTATDRLITNRTWCQNTYVTVEPRTAAAAAALVAIDQASAQFAIDGTNSGLGGTTGLPVLILPMIFANISDAQNWVDVDVDVLVEIRHTPSR